LELNTFVRTLEGFSDWQHVEKIKTFAWHLHTHRKLERFSGTDIRDCFKELGIAGPTSISPFLNDLASRKPPLLLRDSGGYQLERTLRDQLDSRYGHRAITVQALQTLRDLPAKLPNLAEQAYLEEALTCFKAGAFKATIVMTWNVAYDHLCNHILGHARLPEFNTSLNGKKLVAEREDFYDYIENRVLEAARASGITGKNVHAVFDASLRTRNRAAHASGSTFEQPQAENYILELLNNAVLKL
jgi:hypothetical protein